MELVQAITSMQSNKALGPDGFLFKIKKEFANKFAPILKLLYQYIFNQNTMHGYMYRNCTPNRC